MKDNDYESRILRDLARERETVRNLVGHREALQDVWRGMEDDVLCTVYVAPIAEVLRQLDADINYHQGHVDALAVLVA